MARASGLDFVAFDVETANQHRGSVCALGLSVVRGGVVRQCYSWLCRPPAELDWFSGWNTAIHGIRAEDVAKQPRFADRLAEALAVIGGSTVVAHNASFDMGAVRDGCTAGGSSWPTLRYGCTLVMARRSLDLISYRLPSVADALAVPAGRHHEAGSDAEVSARIALALAKRFGVGSLDDLASASGVTLGSMTPWDWIGCRRASAGASSFTLSVETEHLLSGAHVVFTGALGITRAEAWARIAEVGAIPQANVTQATQFLVVGDGFRGDDPAAFSTGKAAKATRLRAKGQRIEVLTEDDLEALLADVPAAT